MLVLSLCIVLPVLGVSSGIFIENNYEELNSRIQFASRIQTVLESKNGSKLSPECSAHVKQYRRNLISGRDEDVWALRMFDARSKIPSGLLDGNMADFGSFDECLNIEAESPQSGNIFGKYCIGTIPINKKKLENGDSQRRLTFNQLFGFDNSEKRGSAPGGIGIQLAKCLPHSCSADDIQHIYSHLGIVFSEELCQTKSSQPGLDGGSIAMISFLGLVLWIILASTAYDAVLHYFKKKPHHSILIAFSALTNGKKMLTTSNGPNQISCLHGIRVISTMWVILGHRYNIQGLFPLNNYLDAFKWMDNTANMFIIGATVSVDTFFVISGLVIAYSFMSAMAKGTKFNIIMYYIHRYLRLTPVLAVVILIHITLLRHLGSGPIWPHRIQSDLIDSCEKYWWKALLYIQNYGSQDGQCVTQSWYLSVDTQLFVLAPILLIPLSKWPKFTLSATGFLTVCSIVACFLTAWFFEVDQSVLLGADPQKRKDFFQYYYYGTHTRAAPWFIGIILGYIVYVFKQRRTKLIINKVIIFFVWTTSLAVLCACVFAGHDLIFGEFNKVLNAFHLALMRPAWSVALCCIIFLCVIEYGGPVNWFLSLPIFQVLSKLTFTLYLAHYTVIYFTTAQMRIAPRFSNVEMMYVFWGDFVFTLVVALVLTLAFESPIITIEKVLFGGAKRPNPRSQLNEEERPKITETV